MMKRLMMMLILSSAAFGQVTFQIPAIESQVPQPIAGLTGVVCLDTSTGAPCTPTVTVYSDKALSVPITTLTTNGDGLFPTFFVTPGQYQWCASDTLGRISAYCTKFTAPSVSGSSPTFVNVTVTGNELVGGTLGVTGKITNSNWNNVRSVDGTTLTTIQACINALPTAGGVCLVPPGDPVTGKYLETLSANIVLKKNTVVQFLGGCIVTQGAFILSVPQGADDVSIFSPFAHSSDQGGNAQGCTFQGYTGAVAAVDIGSSAGFTYNTLIRGIHVNLASAQAGAVGIRRTNEVGGPLEYDEVVFGPVSGQVGFKFIGTGALFDGTSELTGLELNSSASATNNIGFQFTGTNQNGYNFHGGHANMGGSVNGSVCIDAAAGASKIDLGGFYCDVAATGVTVESVINTAVRGWFIVDSGVTAFANFGAGSLANWIETDTRSIGSQLVTDNGTAGTNSVTNGQDMQWNSRRWGVVSEAGGSGFQIVDKSDNSQMIAKGVGGATHVDSSAGNPVRTNQNSGVGVEFWNAGASVLTIDAAGTMHPGVAAAVGLGTTALPFLNVFMGTAATNNFKFQPAATTGARIITMADPLSPTTVALPMTIASGTASMTTALIATVACGTTVTVAATGVLTTDVIDADFNAAVTASNNGLLIPHAWPTAGNVNFNYCNPTAAGQTPTAMTVNWSVRRP